MSNLDGYRIEIDEIDKELVALFERRMDIACKVGEYKKKNNLPIFNGAREAEVINKNVAMLKNIEYSKIARDFFNNMMELSRSLQSDIISDAKNNYDENILYNENICCHKKNSNIGEKKSKGNRLGFQGVKGAFSEEALIKYFGNVDEAIEYEEFEEVFDALKREEIDYGILPIENSYTGAITQVYDLLVKYGFYIIGEECIKIDQHLIGLSDSRIEDIEEIYSHPQGFEQSREFLKKYNHLRLIPYHNTAISAKLVSESKDKKKAAIASKRAADIYGLEILKEKINDNKDNHTKFIIVGRDLEYNTDCNKVSVVFSLEDKAGTLYSLLRYFAENNINMIKIESRPDKHQSWKYLLYVDFEGNIDNIEVKNALELIKKSSEYFKLLGGYRCA